MAVKYRPLKRDSISGNLYHESVTVQCRHPAVVRHYGRGQDTATVTVWQCRKCQFVDKHPLFGGYKCTLEDGDGHAPQ